MTPITKIGRGAASQTTHCCLNNAKRRQKDFNCMTLKAASQTIDVAYRFHPVGQGLFASGHLNRRHGLDGHRAPDFSWVYDCGTNSSVKRYLLPELDNLLAQHNAPLRARIDLVTLSHFDSDHLNGLTELLDRFDVKTLLLPLIPLWKRLELAFAEGVSLSGDSISFYLNPVAYLLRHFSEQVQSIILVPTISPEYEPFVSESDRLHTLH